jgi:uridine kinase
VIVGVGGISGSGKTTLARIITSKIANSKIISLDNYYLDLTHITYEERKKVNYDIPESLELSLLVEHLELLKQGKKINVPIYDFTQHVRTSKTYPVEPTEVIIFDGIFISAIPELTELLDLLIFVDINPEIAVIRRIRRDIIERGREIEGILSQLEKTVIPAYRQNIIPSKHRADIIVNGENKNIELLASMLCSSIEKLVERKKNS